MVSAGVILMDFAGFFDLLKFVLANDLVPET